MKTSKLSLVEKIFLMLLLLFSVSLFDQAGLILAALIVLFFLFSLKRTIKGDNCFFALFLFSIFYFVNYALFWPVGYKEVIVYMVAPWACYLIGQQIVTDSRDDRILNKIAIIIAVGLFIHGALNLYALYTTYGFSYYYRVAVDFWRNEIISVTGCSLYYVPLMSWGIGYLFFGNLKKMKVLAAIAVAVGLISNAVYENRTAVYLLVILLSLAIITTLIRNKAKLIVWITIILTIITILVVWSLDVAGIRSYIWDLEVTQRLISEEVGRVGIWLNFLSGDWWRYPFGGEQVDFLYGHAHNLWLDTLYQVGFAPFVFLLLFTVWSGVSVRRYFYKASYAQQPYLYLLLGMVVSCCVEPIIEANPYFFLSLVMIVGAISGDLQKEVAEIIS